MTTELGSGGQGTVYAVRHGGVDMAYKKYDDDVLGLVNVTVLEAMVAFRNALSGPQRAQLDECNAWPTDVVARGAAVTDFLMPAIPAAFRTRPRFPRGYKDVFGQVQLLLNDDGFLIGRELTVDDRFRLDFLRDTAATLELLHELGCVVGDLSPNNLFFSVVRRPRCYFIDCDGMVLRGASVLGQLETNDWQLPEEDSSRGTARADSYKFGLLCLRLFAGHQSPRDAGTAALDRAGARIGRQTRQCIDGPVTGRLTMKQWRVLLDSAEAAKPVMVKVPSVRRGRRPVKTVVAVLTALALTYPPWKQAAEDWLDTAVATLASDAPAEQAAAVANLLSSSKQDRKRVNTAVGNVLKCRSPSSATAGFREAASARQIALERTGRLRTEALPHGDQLKKQLAAALRHSGAADLA